MGEIDMKRTQKIVLTALFAAMITVMTAYICHIPTGLNEGYIHFGDALIYLAASILPLPYAIAAAAIGAGLADLLTAPAWMVATIIVKSLLCLPFSSKPAKIVNLRNIIGIFIGIPITVLGYAVAETIMYGSWAGAVASMMGNVIQSSGSAALFMILGLALDKVGIKNRIQRM